MMDFARYWLAVLLWMNLPGGILYWFSVHPFIRFWRALGTVPTLVIHYSGMLMIAVAVFWFRRSLLVADFGTNWVLVAFGAALLAASFVLKRKVGKQLKYRILTGVPELSREPAPGALLTEGIYSRIRHPRYSQVIVTVAGYSLIANYLECYILVLLAAGSLYLVTLLEEKELRNRFGAAYEAYGAGVPRFLPRLRR
jgi:protein-S-isoprenylcysteine O-methyltransferase Ste14